MPGSSRARAAGLGGGPLTARSRRPKLGADEQTSLTRDQGLREHPRWRLARAETGAREGGIHTGGTSSQDLTARQPCCGWIEAVARAHGLTSRASDVACKTVGAEPTSPTASVQSNASVGSVGMETGGHRLVVSQRSTRRLASGVVPASRVHRARHGPGQRQCSGAIAPKIRCGLHRQPARLLCTS